MRRARYQCSTTSSGILAVEDGLLDHGLALTQALGINAKALLHHASCAQPTWYIAIPVEVIRGRWLGASDMHRCKLCTHLMVVEKKVANNGQPRDLQTHYKNTLRPSGLEELLLFRTMPRDDSGSSEAEFNSFAYPMRSKEQVTDAGYRLRNAMVYVDGLSANYCGYLSATMDINVEAFLVRISWKPLTAKDQFFGVAFVPNSVSITLL
jgi:hypothetical protein